MKLAIFAVPGASEVGWCRWRSRIASLAGLGVHFVSSLDRKREIIPRARNGAALDRLRMHIRRGLRERPECDRADAVAVST